MSEFRYPRRMAGVRALLSGTDKQEEVVDAVIVSHLENVRYLTGFTGSSGLALITPTDAVFFTDGRYGIQAAAEVPGFERVVLPQGSSLSGAAGEAVKQRGLKRVAFEDARLTVREYEDLKKAMPDDLALIGRSGLVESLRRIKDADEIAALRKAVVLADACFEHIRQIARPGRTEKEIAWEMETFLRAPGRAPRLSFESIVAAGPNGALPHARPSDRKLGASGGPEFVVFDYGAEVDGYCSDITRTLVVGGEPTPRQREVYGAVLTAQLAALDAIQPGKIGKDIDAVARESLTGAGLGEAFSHGLGHLLGREVHDAKPFSVGFSPRSDLVLEPGMVITVEPGVYLEGFGGVRIEDDILVTETGCEILTQSTKDLIAV